MTQKVPKDKYTQALVWAIIRAWGFNYARRTEWTIYGARHQPCEACKSSAYMPCVNLTDLRAGREPRINKQPHDERVDWERILEGLKTRGYYREAIEANFKKGVQVVG